MGRIHNLVAWTRIVLITALTVWIATLIPAAVAQTCIEQWMQGQPYSVPGTDGDVRAVAVLPDGSLVAGGSFSTAGGVLVNKIARWNGSSWAPLGNGMNGSVSALALMPNGDVVAGGDFTTAGGMAANRVARWDGTAWSALGSGFNG